MKLFAPKYYDKFQCIGGKCTKNCCIGWEIDIDPKTAKVYSALDGEIGNKIRKSISQDGECPHFRLCDGERCANLREDNLCFIIAECGDKMIPEICREHPRFYNVTPDFCEVGIGLACPTAAALILSAHEHKVCEIGQIDTECEDDFPEAYKICRVFMDTLCDISSIYTPRNTVIFATDTSANILSDILFDVCTGKNAGDTNTDTFIFCEGVQERFVISKASFDDLISLFSELEILDCGYDKKIESAIRNIEKKIDEAKAFYKQNQDKFISLFHYFIFRHLICGATEGTVFARVVFATLSAFMIMALSFDSKNDLCDEAVDYSRNIEYSDQNIYTFIDCIENAKIGTGIDVVLSILGE